MEYLWIVIAARWKPRLPLVEVAVVERLAEVPHTFQWRVAATPMPVPMLEFVQP